MILEITFPIEEILSLVQFWETPRGEFHLIRSRMMAALLQRIFSARKGNLLKSSSSSWLKTCCLLSTFTDQLLHVVCVYAKCTLAADVSRTNIFFDNKGGAEILNYLFSFRSSFPYASSAHAASAFCRDAATAAANATLSLPSFVVLSPNL